MAELRILRGALAVFGLCALLAIVMFTASDYFWRQMNSQYQTSFASFRDVSRKYLAVDDEARAIAEHYPTFVTLYRRGVIGNEHRLSWVETLRGAADELGLPELDFKIDAQRVLQPDFALNSGIFEVGVSAMHLQLGLVHEGDLLGLLDLIDQRAEGLYSVERCDFTRTDVGATRPAAGEANIRAECTLRWFTLDQRGGVEIRL